MILCDPVTIPESFDENDRVCRACGKQTRYALEARDYHYTYPSCKDSSCVEIVVAQMTDDVKRAGAAATKRAFRGLWSWFRQKNDRPSRVDQFM